LYDTLVVGAGSAGSYLAGRLASWGHRVLVVERQAGFGKATCCTGIVSNACLESFHIGRPAVVHESSSARFFSPSGECIRMARESTQAVVLDRTAFDTELARDAQAAGAEYLMSTEVVRVANTGKTATVQVSTQGRQSTIGASAVAIASGFNSGISELLGLGHIDSFAMGAQSEVQTTGLEEVEVYFGSHLAPGFFAWLVPTSDSTALAGLLSQRNTASHMTAFLNKLQAEHRITSLPSRVRHGGVPLRPLRKTYGQRVVVVGDAAGQVKPTTGGGIYYGLLCADIAADVLHRAIARDDFSARSLSSYERRWKLALGRELRLGRWARWLFEKLNDRQIDYIFRRAGERHIPEALLSPDVFSFDSHSGMILRGARLFGVAGVAGLLRRFARGK